MSAILAVWNRNGKPVAADTVDQMLAVTPHLSIDGQDVWLDGAIALAHQHFWITPEEAGERQPLVMENGRRFEKSDGRF